MTWPATAASRGDRSPITSILLMFTEGREHSPTGIAHLAGLLISTAHRLVWELVAQRL